MPKSELHTTKRRKNLAVLAILIGIVTMFFFLTMVKMKSM